MREILYDKKSKSLPPLTVINDLIPKKKESALEEDIVAWIKAHNKFKWSKMCLEIGIDKGNFQRMLKKGKITLPDEKIKQIKQSISEYGWK